MPGEILDLKEYIGKYKISTVDLGEFLIEHPDVIGAYETMIFKDGESIGYQVRYKTEEEARKGHQEAIDFIKGNKVS